jgi:serine/threonine protein phosphatase PrpC
MELALMKFSIYQESRQGTRRNNEDRVGYAYSREALLMVVADGMGGHLHGEVASHIAVQFMLEEFRCEATPRLADPSRFLEDGMTHAHHAILDYARARRLPETPRTTCVACLVQDGTACWAHVGDSRLYHLREGRIQARTRDHSRVQQLVDEGRIREEAVHAHPERNRILNCLGSLNLPYVELSQPVLLHADDTLLLCSDGFWGPLSNTGISQALAKEGLMTAVPDLINAAEARAGRDCDNLSVVAITWADAAPTAPHQVSTRTLPVNDVSTRLEDFGQSAQTDLTDEEIERAIEEIRAAIRRNTLK